MTPLQQSLDAVIAQGEAENTGDGHVAAALSFLYRAQAALQDKADAEAAAEEETPDASQE